MESYYVPPGIFSEAVDDLSFIPYSSYYRVFAGCPTDIPTDTVFYSINNWGRIIDVGSSTISTSDKLVIGVGCTEYTNEINVATISRSILDVDNLTPYEPFYTLGFLFLIVFMFLFSIRLLFGRNYR